MGWSRVGSYGCADRRCVLPEGSLLCREEGKRSFPHSPCLDPTQSRSWSSWGQGTNRSLPGVVTHCEILHAKRESQQMPPWKRLTDAGWVADCKQTTLLWRQEWGTGAAARLPIPQGHLDGAEGKGARSLPQPGALQRWVKCLCGVRTCLSPNAKAQTGKLHYSSMNIFHDCCRS